MTGRQAWSRFFDEIHSAALYDWEGDTVPQQALLTRLYSADRDVRKRAAASLTRGLREIRRSTTYIANTILADLASENRLRRYPSWISSRNMDNQVDDAVVDALVNAVCSRYDLVARYYRLKKKLLGLPELFDYDRYAPIASDERRYSWEEARETVISAYRRFHPRMAEIASLFFAKGWIDASVHPGKRGGAFCAATVPSLHPYVLVNFQGKSDDVMTLAHELGHGVHQYLSRPQGILSWSTPLTTAETASIFGETLVFQDLLAREDDPGASVGMLVRRIESSFATVFRQVAMNRFEDAAHRARADGELTTESFSEMWLSTQRAMFADSVTLSARLRNLVELHPPFHPHPRVRLCLRVRGPACPCAVRPLPGGGGRLCRPVSPDARRGRLRLAASPGQAARGGPDGFELLVERPRPPVLAGGAGGGAGTRQRLNG